MNKQLITKEQIRLIKTVQRKHMDDDDYYDMLMQRFKVSSCTQMTRRQASELIELYIEWGWVPKKPRKQKRGKRKKKTVAGPMRKGNMVRLVSPGQRNKINVLANLIEWRVKDGLTKWIAKRFSIQRVKTAKEAYQAIEGLKGMFENAMKEKYGEAWFLKAFDDPEVQKYIQEHVSNEKLEMISN